MFGYVRSCWVFFIIYIREDKLGYLHEQAWVVLEVLEAFCILDLLEIFNEEVYAKLLQFC